MFKNYTNCIQMTSGFTFVVASSVPEYVHSKPISTHSGGNGRGEEKRGKVDDLVITGNGTIHKRCWQFFSDFSPLTPSPISAVFQFYPLAILINFRPFPLPIADVVYGRPQ